MKKQTDNYTPPSAPSHLSERAAGLWAAIVGPRPASPGRLALIQTALEALDRADEAREAIARDGMVTGEGKMIHAHPLLKVEKDGRAQFASIWNQLNLNWRADMDR